MTRLVIRLLLLAVVWTAGVGLPAHHAQHLLRMGEAVAACQLEDECQAPHEELHASCEWCHAFAQALAMAGPPPQNWQSHAEAERFEPSLSAPPVRCARPWAFASRDPPRA